MNRLSQAKVAILLTSIILFLGTAMVIESAFGQDSGALSSISVDVSDNDTAAPHPPHVYAELCQQGASGTGQGGGAAIVTPNPVCEQIRIYGLYEGAFTTRDNLCQKASIYCEEWRLEYYQERMAYALSEADRMTNQTKHTGQIARWSYDLLPLGALIWVGFAL
jgi:hypothetical protein